MRSDLVSLDLRDFGAYFLVHCLYGSCGFDFLVEAHVEKLKTSGIHDRPEVTAIFAHYKSAEYGKCSRLDFVPL